MSVYIVIALDDAGVVRECVALSDFQTAMTLFERLKPIWGGANVAMCSRVVDDLPLNLQELLAK